MATAGLNAMALVRFHGFRMLHGGGNGGFAWLLFGLLAIGIAVWAVTRTGQGETAKN